MQAAVLALKDITTVSLPDASGTPVALSGTDSKADEEFAILLYHLVADQTGNPASEYPPTDCGSSGFYVCTELEGAEAGEHLQDRLGCPRRAVTAPDRHRHGDHGPPVVVQPQDAPPPIDHGLRVKRGRRNAPLAQALPVTSVSRPRGDPGEPRDVHGPSDSPYRLPRGVVRTDATTAISSRSVL